MGALIAIAMITKVLSMPGARMSHCSCTGKLNSAKGPV